MIDNWLIHFPSILTNFLSTLLFTFDSLLSWSFSLGSENMMTKFDANETVCKNSPFHWPIFQEVNHFLIFILSAALRSFDVKFLVLNSIPSLTSFLTPSIQDLMTILDVKRNDMIGWVVIAKFPFQLTNYFHSRNEVCRHFETSGCICILDTFSFLTNWFLFWLFLTLAFENWYVEYKKTDRRLILILILDSFLNCEMWWDGKCNCALMTWLCI